MVKISWPYRGSYSVKKNKTQSFDSPWFGFSLCFCRCLFLIVNFLSSPRFPKSSGVDPKKALAKTACDLAGEPNSVVQLEPACSIYVYVYTSKYIYMCMPVPLYSTQQHTTAVQEYKALRSAGGIRRPLRLLRKIQNFCEADEEFRKVHA